MSTQSSQDLFTKAQDFIPGGVNSPVRAFKAVGGHPLFIKKAHGALLVDEDDNEYIDLISSWGPMLFGHAYAPVIEAVKEASVHSLSFGAPNKKEVEIAQLIADMVPSVEKVRMVNSGTEATMSAVRLARGFTGRNKIIKIDGCYHGHGDSFLIAAGSGAITFGQPNSPGVTQGTAADTLIAPYNDVDQIELLIKENPGQIAALIIEPVPGNMGLVLPNPGYLEQLRAITAREDILLIFDEVMTGFRLAPGGAQELLGVSPDLTTLGKIIGGGMPVGAYGGRKDIMDYVSPSGPVYQAGTLSGNPVAMAAGIAMLKGIKENTSVYSEMDELTKHMAEKLVEAAAEVDLPIHVNQLGSMICVFFTPHNVYDFSGAQDCNMEMFSRYFHLLLNDGIYLPPSQYESWFLSSALTQEHADKIVSSSAKAFKRIAEEFKS